MMIRDAYENGVKELQARGFEEKEARLAVRRLLDDLCGVSHAHLLKENEDAPAGFAEKIARLAEGEPLAYVLSTQEFFGLPFRCDERALVPRPETELLVELAVARLQNKPRVLIADLGTGSGAIAVAVAHSLPQSRVCATDLSSEARQLAQLNATQNGVENRIGFFAGMANQWAQPLLPEYSEMFDALLSNPPYIAAAEIETLQPQVRDYEPRLALDGGADGLDCYREIAAQCGTLLKPDGFLAVELGAGQFEAVRAIFEASGWRVGAPIFDFAGHARVLSARR